jgi:hypothetical protein
MRDRLTALTKRVADAMKATAAANKEAAVAAALQAAAAAVEAGKRYVVMQLQVGQVGMCVLCVHVCVYACACVLCVSFSSYARSPSIHALTHPFSSFLLPPVPLSCHASPPTTLQSIAAAVTGWRRRQGSQRCVCRSGEAAWRRRCSTVYDRGCGEGQGHRLCRCGVVCTGLAFRVRGLGQAQQRWGGGRKTGQQAKEGMVRAVLNA